MSLAYVSFLSFCKSNELSGEDLNTILGIKNGKSLLKRQPKSITDEDLARYIAQIIVRKMK